MAHTQSLSIQIPEGKILDHLKSMLESKKFGDVIIEADGKEFLVYRGILQMRSPVFAAMFEHSFEEQKENRVVIEDAKHEVVQEMLTYIYTDTAPNLKNVAENLLCMADKYDLERLKIMCEAALGAKLTKENAIDTLILADTYTAVQLKTSAINFITDAESSHFLEKSISESTAARLVAVNRPNLIAEMTRAFHNCRSEATLTFKKKNFSTLKEQVLSPPCMIRNLPWRIVIKPEINNGFKYLGFYLECNGGSKSSSWSCYARAKLLIRSQKAGVNNHVKKINETFSQKSYNWGFPNFIKWSTLTDPYKGFIKDDTVIFQIRVNTEAPHNY